MDMAQRSLPRNLPAHLKRALWRRWLRLRYLLFQRHRHNRLVLERVAGYPILVLPEVFNPALFYTSELLAQTLARQPVDAGAAVLDLGTGSGIGAIAAARQGGEVIAVDINPAAVRCARINVLLNQVEDRVVICQGDLYAPAAGTLWVKQFDVVLFNPPYFRGAPRDALDRAFRATDVVERFVAGLAAHLKPRGFALVAYSSLGDVETFLAACAAQRLDVDVAGERILINEHLWIYRVRNGENDAYSL